MSKFNFDSIADHIEDYDVEDDVSIFDRFNFRPGDTVKSDIDETSYVVISVIYHAEGENTLIVMDDNGHKIELSEWEVSKVD